jgi:DNA-binding MarR family transcriptional regulator
VSTFARQNRFVSADQELGQRLGAWMNLLQADAVMAEVLERHLEAVGLSLAQHEVLMRLARAERNRLRMLDLATLLLVSKSGVTRLVDRMEAAGLVRREACPTDRRVVYAALTDEGRRRIEAARPVFARGLEAAFSRHLDDRDVATLRAILRKVLEGNGQWQERRCSPTYEAESAEPARVVS